MRFPYHQIEDDTIEPAGNIQSSATNHDTTEDERMFSSTRSLLPYWPFWGGCLQIGVGFLCALFGALQVFIVPFLTDIHADAGLNINNYFGAAIWSGFMLVIAGSCAVRASSIRDITSVIQFYVVTVLGLKICFSMLILMIWCNVYNGDTLIIDSSKIHKYSVISLLSAVWCLLGCLLLFLSTTNYFCPVLFGEVQLLKKLAICWLPCCFYLPPKEVLTPYKQEQTIKV